MAASLAAGLVLALLLAAAPFIPAQESRLTGAMLCGFALGWGLLVVLSARFTDQPQWWALAPALFMGVCGLLLAGFGAPIQAVLNWVWPPAVLVLAIWMFLRARRRLRSRAGRVLVYPVIVALALASIGGGFETVSEVADARTYPMPGRLIDVGGHALHLDCTGSGAPTIMLEPGAGLASSSMGWIAPDVAREARVCVYDRAGLGWSEPAGSAEAGRQVAADLHALLHRANVPGPYVLAGHSFGGLYVLSFAARYPDEVAGLVLVDSTAPNPAAQPAATAPEGSGSSDIPDRLSALASTSARLGLVRLYAWSDYNTLPPRSRDEARATAAKASQLRSTIDEYLHAGAAAREAAALADFDHKPLAVLTAGSGNAPGWTEKQDALAKLSPNSVHRVVDGATHASLLLDQQDAAAVSRAILDVVASVRDEAPLAR
ncbi:alpha/beta hydrolase [Paeniglutamicibacter psychrophenolicus]|uniref:alpha/beta hydrolase n=1 Tax=Paeniglutamicibacter psychrophenolicus TaxID=257454 RepID=UPI002782BA96|nr:alpha/beta hydrolase [Paeniglutamicibacter psychrophenolicus]MDQ0093952.1 pimeloyl-ACP methyl ester carboxylesterase [Paeniglutamicibacter psychrophenolicus]